MRDYAYALRWQARAALNRTDPAAFAGGSRAPVVVLPGVYETWRFLQPLIEQIHARGHPVHVVEALRHNQRPVEEMAAEVTAYLERAGVEGVVLVAHSKGGLSGKLVMAGPAGARVRGMLAIATPFGGSRYARLMPLRSLRAFAPSHASITGLARQRGANARIVSVYGRFDPHIPEGSLLDGARNVRVDTGGHFRILAHPRVVEEFTRLAGE